VKHISNSVSQGSVDEPSLLLNNGAFLC